MIEEQAVITSQNGELVTLEVERPTACSLCGKKRGCGNATWGKALGHDQHRVEVKNTLGANVGDLVIVGLEEKVVLNAALFLYVVPLVFMLLVAWLVHTTVGDDLAVMVGSVAGLAIGFMLTKRFYRPQSGCPSEQNSRAADNQPYARLLRIVGVDASK